MISIKGIKKRFKLKDAVLQLEFNRGGRAKAKQMDADARAEMETNRKLLANLRERQSITLDEMRTDCDREIARARKAEEYAKALAQKTKDTYQELITEAENVLDNAKYTASRNARGAAQVLKLMRKLETMLADLLQGPAQLAGNEKDLRRLIATQKSLDKTLYKPEARVN
jgi:cell division septum initiation protein DivIVA